MRFLGIVLFTLTALLIAPVVDQGLGGVGLRPNLYLAPLALALSLCPGAAAVAWCGLLGLALDCLSGPQLGARAACFSLLVALGSTVVLGSAVSLRPTGTGRREESWPRRIGLWWLILFVAEMLCRIIEFSAGRGTLHCWKSCVVASLSAAATTIFLSALWLAVEIVSGRGVGRSVRRFALSIDRARIGA